MNVLYYRISTATHIQMYYYRLREMPYMSTLFSGKYNARLFLFRKVTELSALTGHY